MRSAAAAAIVVLLVPAAAAPGRETGTSSFAVGYTTAHALAYALARSDATLVRRLAPLRVAEVRAVDAAALRRAPGIRYVQRVASRAEAAARAAAPTSSSPEWQLQATHVDGVPEQVLRAAAAITIGVVDTGADVSAPDIAAKSPLTYNTRTGTADVRDPNGHGTFVASLAAGSVTNGDGFDGSGGDARLVVVKSGSDGGSFTDVDEAAGIVYAVDHGARIVNLSVGGPSTSATERRAIRYAVDHGALVVAAVGNEYAQRNPVEYPAALLQPVGSNGVGGAGLAVTATSRDGSRAPFANTGSWVSLAAPGVHVLGAVSGASSPSLYPRTPLPGATAGLYGYASGTSFAVPQVAGAAALVWAANPALSAAQVAQILKETASGRGRWTPALGFGVLDVAAAVARAQQGVPGVLLAGLRDRSRVNLDWSGDDAASYTLTLTTDGHATRDVLAATQQTRASIRLAGGHTYSFTVSSLDAGGASTATSSPLTFVVPRS